MEQSTPLGDNEEHMEADKDRFMPPELINRVISIAG